MKKIRQNGFVLLLVIIAIALVGAATCVLAGGANIMLFQSDTVYLQARERNLMASGLAWAKQNIKNRNQGSFNKMVELDTANLGIRDSSLNVFISFSHDKQEEVQINISCSRARQTFKRDNRYIIEL
ncbi:MAG: hypothetical protein MUP16_12710 [Sedimentisphaerales bacterium]|nr:hypothetical protein [Sedimentisphaerales bacterium]